MSAALTGSEFAKEIEQRGFVDTPSGERIRLHSSIGSGQGEFLAGLVQQVKPAQSVEIGVAFGLSTLYICEKLSLQAQKTHVLSDPFQNDEVWQGCGLHHIDSAGYRDITRFYEEPGDVVVARMALAGERIQFAYVDADKRFDSNLVYFWWLDKMLDFGGILVWDDCDWPALRRLARLIAQHPNYTVHATYGNSRGTLKRRLWEKAKLFGQVSKPDRARVLLRLNRELGIDFHCIAFRKARDENINWDWQVDF